MLKDTKPSDLLDKASRFRRLLRDATSNWPSLRATAVVGLDVDFTLIPRAMQAEEDLVRVLNEFKSLELLS
jgi:hypothetical protein